MQLDCSFCDDGLTGRMVLRTDEVDEDRASKSLRCAATMIHDLVQPQQPQSPCSWLSWRDIGR